MSKKNGKHISGNPQKRAAQAAEKKEQRMHGFETIRKNIALLAFASRNNKTFYAVKREDEECYEAFIKKFSLDQDEKLIGSVRKWSKMTKTPNEGILILGKDRDDCSCEYLVDSDEDCISKALKAVCA